MVLLMDNGIKTCCTDLRDFIDYWGPANVQSGFGGVRILVGDEYKVFRVCPFCGVELVSEN